MEKFKHCKYWLYQCHYEAEEGSKYCDYHKYLMDVVNALLASVAVMFIAAVATSAFPAHAALIFMVSIALVGGMILRSLKS